MTSGGNVDDRKRERKKKRREGGSREEGGKERNRDWCSEDEKEERESFGALSMNHTEVRTDGGSEW